MRSNKTDCKADLLFSIDSNDREKYDRSDRESFDQEFFDEKIAEFGNRVVKTLVENYQKNNN